MVHKFQHINWADCQFCTSFVQFASLWLSVDHSEEAALLFMRP